MLLELEPGSAKSDGGRAAEEVEGEEAEAREEASEEAEAAAPVTVAPTSTVVCGTAARLVRLARVVK